MNLLYLTILLPFLGFLILSCSQGKWSRVISAIIGVGSIAISTLVTAYIIFIVCDDVYNNNVFIFIQKLWTWFSINDFNITVELRLDGLSLLMLSIVMGIGCIIHVYSVWYIKDSEGYSRFFAYTNLFMSNMVLLILSNNLLLMYFGWEGVGLCSYLLIGFNYFDYKNNAAAFKAFIITRFGDICLVFALFMLYQQFHTLNISELLNLDLQCLYEYKSYNMRWISLMLLVGAISKSAQLPLHNWLISAMVGPTPVSALIHAATMVTSGVYLIVRMKDFFVVTPDILYAIGVIGACTMIIFSFSALLQSNIKKILAYSTVSQLGYMFLALGGKHWTAAMFHLTTHAFFKALLFLSAGSLIYVCKNEQNIFKMGVLYKSVPLIYFCFLIGGASLSAVPIITAGFYSKEMILLQTLSSNNYFFCIFGLIGVLLTPIYVFRMIFIIFHGNKKIVPRIYDHAVLQSVPLIVLCILSTFVGGLIKLPILNVEDYNNDTINFIKVYIQVISVSFSIIGIWLASFFWLYSIPNKMIRSRNIEKYKSKEIVARYMVLLCYYGWGFDALYKVVFVRLYLFIVNKLFLYDPVIRIENIILSILRTLKNGLQCFVNGQLNWYAALMNIGVIFTILVIMFSCCKI